MEAESLEKALSLLNDHLLENGKTADATGANLTRLTYANIRQLLPKNGCALISILTEAQKLSDRLGA